MGRMQLYPLKRHGVCRKHGDRRSRNGYHTGKTLHLGQSGFRLSGRMESAVPKRFPNPVRHARLPRVPSRIRDFRNMSGIGMERQRQYLGKSPEIAARVRQGYEVLRRLPAPLNRYVFGNEYRIRKRRHVPQEHNRRQEFR